MIVIIRLDLLPFDEDAKEVLALIRESLDLYLRDNREETEDNCVGLLDGENYGKDDHLRNDEHKEHSHENHDESPPEFEQLIAVELEVYFGHALRAATQPLQSIILDVVKADIRLAWQRLALQKGRDVRVRQST